MALVKMPDNGQQFTLEDEIAQSDDLLKAALRAVYPEIGDARISRENKDGQMVVSIVKQAGRKGAAPAMALSEPLLLDMDQIRTDGGTQTRAAIDMDVAAEYAEAIGGGATFPPVDVMFDGTNYWLTDGFHRLAAARRAGREEIEARVSSGDRRSAILAAVGANQAHGLRRTNDDKRRAVRALLSDEEWVRWSDRAIAEACGVAHTFVSVVRKELSGNGLQMPQERVVQRGEQTYTFTPAAPVAKPEPSAMPVIDGAYIAGLQDGEGTEIDEERPEEEASETVIPDDLAEDISAAHDEGMTPSIVSPPAAPAVGTAPRPAPTPLPPAPAPAAVPATPSVKALPWEQTEYTITLSYRPEAEDATDRFVICTVSTEGLAPLVTLKRASYLPLPAVIRDEVERLEKAVTERFEGAK